MKSPMLLLLVPTIVGLSMSHNVFADAASTNSAADAVDVVLDDGGLLLGQLVGAQGRPRQNVVVRFHRGRREVASATTNTTGRFVVKGVSAGTYRATVDHGQILVRAWTKSSAPPSASRGVLLVEGITVRGQETFSYGGSTGTLGVASFNQPTHHHPAYDAPDSAVPSRGPCGLGILGRDGLLTSPFGAAVGGLAAAIAIPIALNDSDAS